MVYTWDVTGEKTQWTVVDQIWPMIFILGLQKKKGRFVEAFHFLWFNLQEELLNGYKGLCEKIIKSKLKDYFKQIPKTPFE